MLLQRDGYEVNHKRVYRLYVEERLWVRKRGRKQRIAVPRMPMRAPTGVNEVWSMDFVSDALATGRRFRILNIADDFTREAPAIEVDTSLGGVRVTRVLDRLKIERGLPGKPIENAYIESFNAHFRDECLNDNWFTTLADARQTIEEWRQDYNQRRPHNSLGYRTPEEFAHMAAVTSYGKDGDTAALENASRLPLSHSSGGGRVKLSNPRGLSL